MANEVIGIDIVARLDKLRAEIATLSPEMASQAKAMTAALAKEVRQQTKAMKELSASAQGAGTSMGAAASQAQNLRAQLFDVVQQVSAGQNPMMILNQQGFQIAQALQGGAGASAALAAALGPLGMALAGVAAVLGVAYGAWRQVHEEQERGSRIAAALMADQRELASVYDTERAALVDLAVARQTMTEAERVAFTTSAALHKQLTAAQSDTSARVKDLRTQAGSMTAQFAEWGEQINGSIGWVGAAAMAIDGYTQSSSELAAEADGLMAGMAEQASAFRDSRDTIVGARVEMAKLAEDERAASDAAKAHEDARRKQAAALREQERALEDLYRAEREYSAAQAAFDDATLERGKKIVSRISDIQAATADAQIAELDGMARIEAERERAIGKLESQLASDLALVENNERAKVLIAEETAALRAAVEAKYAAQAAKAEDAARTASAQLAGRLLGDVSAMAADAAASQAAQGQDGAMAAFGVAKGLAMAEAAVNTALAVSAALATIPPPLNAIAAGVALAQGVAQEAKIASTVPSFSDTPGPVRLDGGGLARFAAGDYVVAAQSREELARQAAPSVPASIRVVSEVHYGHRSFNRFIRDNLVSGGPLHRAVRGDKKVGHREDRG